MHVSKAVYVLFLSVAGCIIKVKVYLIKSGFHIKVLIKVNLLQFGMKIEAVDFLKYFEVSFTYCAPQYCL